MLNDTEDALASTLDSEFIVRMLRRHAVLRIQEFHQLVEAGRPGTEMRPVLVSVVESVRACHVLEVLSSAQPAPSLDLSRRVVDDLESAGQVLDGLSGLELRHLFDALLVDIYCRALDGPPLAVGTEPRGVVGQAAAAMSPSA